MGGPQRMVPYHAKPKNNPKKSYMAKKREARKKRWQNITAQVWIYLFCVVGAVLREVLAINDGVIRFTGTDAATLGGAVVVAIGVMAWSESDGDVKGKKMNMRRRIKEALLLGLASQAVLGDVVGKFL